MTCTPRASKPSPQQSYTVRNHCILCLAAIQAASSLLTTASPPSLPPPGNRAAAYLKTESFGLAISDAEKAKELDATYVKAYYRHASALLALGRYKKALVDFKRVVKLKPKDKAARKKYMECNKAVKRQAFEAAIRTDDAPSAVEAVDVGQIGEWAGCLCCLRPFVGVVC